MPPKLRVQPSLRFAPMRQCLYTAWLMALEEEVENARRPAHEKYDQTLQAIIPYAVLTPEEVCRQLDEWTKRG